MKVDLEDVGGAALSTHAAGMVPADVRDIAGVAVSSTTAQLGVNVVQINAVATTPVTTVNAVQGTTANPLFTGQLIQSDTRDWLGTVVATPATLGIPDINVKNIANAAVSTTTAQIGSNVVQINGVPTSPITTIAANVGTTQPVNFTGTAGAALVKGDTIDINGNATSAQALAQSTSGICWGTCGAGGSTTTAVVSTLNNPASLAVSGELQGRTIIYLGNTTTAALRGQASNITASTTGATPTITYTIMTTAPVSGDTFVIV